MLCYRLSCCIYKSDSAITELDRTQNKEYQTIKSNKRTHPPTHPGRNLKPKEPATNTTTANRVSRNLIREPQPKLTH